MIKTSNSFFGGKRTSIVYKDRPKLSTDHLQMLHPDVARNLINTFIEIQTLATIKSFFKERKTVVSAYGPVGLYCQPEHDEVSGIYTVVYEPGTPSDVVVACHDFLAEQLEQGTQPIPLSGKIYDDKGSTRIILPTTSSMPDSLKVVRKALQSLMQNQNKAIRSIDPSNFIDA